MTTIGRQQGLGEMLTKNLNAMCNGTGNKKGNTIGKDRKTGTGK
jgi:hypothetical protein